MQLESPDAIIQALASGQVDASFDNGALLLYRASRIGAPYLQQAFVLDESLELVFSVRGKSLAGVWVPRSSAFLPLIGTPR